MKRQPYLFLVQDLEKVAEIAEKHYAATVIDNTYATLIFQELLAKGIDMVVHSASKYLGGHSDIGAVWWSGGKKT